jgi:hypothetical protein
VATANALEEDVELPPTAGVVADLVPVKIVVLSPEDEVEDAAPVLAVPALEGVLVVMNVPPLPSVDVMT